MTKIDFYLDIDISENPKVILKIQGKPVLEKALLMNDWDRVVLLDELRKVSSDIFKASTRKKYKRGIFGLIAKENMGIIYNALEKK